MERTIGSLIDTASRGDRAAAAELFSALYAELHRLARLQLAKHGAPGGIGATSLVHEAYVEIAERSGGLFPDRARFMAYAARAMRGLIIDHARSRRALKRGGQFELTSLEDQSAEGLVDERQLTNISGALDQLAEADPALVEVVDLKFFCGFSLREIAVMHGVSERTVQRQWEAARVYLHRTLRTSTGLVE
jgi:RNA polymerase sigma factor (TIGR02999 family)